MSDPTQGTPENIGLLRKDSPLEPCCRETIDRHAAFNPMIVCGECKQILKCFDKIQAFNNYQTFCLSRRREITTSQYKGYFIIGFRSYDGQNY